MPVSDIQLKWFNSYFLAMCVSKAGTEWQRLVTDIMDARHGGAFMQVDPSFSGDQGCDGYVDGLMLACYGAARPNEQYVASKIKDDLKKAKLNWSEVMERWAFVHNNAEGLALMAGKEIAKARKKEVESKLNIEIWPPQTLWREAVRHLDRDQMVVLFGAPPNERPAGMSYISEAIRSMSRTKFAPPLEAVPPVPEGKIEFNEFEESTASLIKETQVHTHLVRYYFERASPGEQYQVLLQLKARYDDLAARLKNPDTVFHTLCDELVEEAFEGDLNRHDAERRSAALLIVTHFFESCLIFKMPGETVNVSA